MRFAKYSACPVLFLLYGLHGQNTPAPNIELWRDPGDISSRNLIFGSGGQKRQPKGITFQFVKEDLKGTSPKMVVTDADGHKWKLKLGDEAQAETTASRLLWAAGYVTDEYYLVPEAHIQELPPNFHRGMRWIGKDGVARNARMKRDPEGFKKVGRWEWKNNPFTGTREFNGLRVMMALINNWDLKDINNAIYDSEHERVYVVSDLGASFGTTRVVPGHNKRRNNLGNFEKSGFVTNASPGFVDFATPGTPTPIVLFAPNVWTYREGLKWIGDHIPRADAKWIGEVLARLSPQQIRDAFLAGGYSSAEAERFAAVIEARIAELNRL